MRTGFDWRRLIQKKLTRAIPIRIRIMGADTHLLMMAEVSIPVAWAFPPTPINNSAGTKTDKKFFTEFFPVKTDV